MTHDGGSVLITETDVSALNNSQYATFEKLMRIRNDL